MAKRKKIAVLGAGMSALSAVYALTKTPNWRDKYDITIYQMGWRIGGKGASGRNAKIGNRIEEHGLHIWFGFYNNAFNLMKDVYANAPLGDSPIRTFDDAFKPHHYIPIMENINGKWESWIFNFPPNNQTVGGTDEFLPLREYIKMALDALLVYFKSQESYIQEATKGTENSFLSKLPFIGEILEKIANKKEEIKTSLEEKALQEAEKVLQVIIDIIANNKNIFIISQEIAQNNLLLLIDGFWNWLKNKIGNLVYTDSTLRRLFVITDVTLTTIKGIFKDKVLDNGLDSLNNIECKDWLRKHGAAEITVNSGLVTALYDVGFAYENGDINKPNYETGNALRIMIRLGLAYKGAFMWKMQAGMGDIVFTPIYKLFESYQPTEEQGGITFKFFHKVKNLGLNKDKTAIENINIEIQATTKNKQPYQPLVTVKGVECWTSEPDYDQLEEGSVLQAQNVNLEGFWTAWQGAKTISLEVGKDFDAVILGTPVGTLPHIAPELLAHSEKWQQMVANVQTVQTQAYQLWYNKDLQELGWDKPSPIATSFAEPVDTWADMSQLIAQEEFPTEHEPRNIAYYCGVLQDAPNIPPATDTSFPAKEAARVAEGLRNYVHNDLPALFPNIKKADGTINWDVFIDLNRQIGEQRLQSQYWRGNIEPHERYTLTNVNSSIYRLKTDETGFENLYITGDWIQTNFNYGCIECCVMAGMMTARAISGEPIQIIGENDIL